MKSFKNISELRNYLIKLEKNPSQKSLKELDLIYTNFMVEYHSTRNVMDKNKWAQYMEECEYSKKSILRKLNVIEARKYKSKSPAKTPIRNKMMYMLGKLKGKPSKNKKKIY